MPFSLVANSSGFSTSGTATTGAMNTAGANLMVAIGGGDGDTISDSNGNTWTDIVAPVADGFTLFAFKYVLNPTVGAGHTVSVASGRVSLCVSAWSGAASSSVLDTTISGASVATGSYGPGSITPSQANSLGIAAAGDIFQAGAPLTINFGTISNTADTVGNFANSSMAYEIQTAATARNYTWSWTGATGVHISAAAAFFKPSAGGGGSHRPRLFQLGWTPALIGISGVLLIKNPKLTRRGLIIPKGIKR